MRRRASCSSKRLIPGLDHDPVADHHRDVAVPHREVAGQQRNGPDTPFDTYHLPSASMVRFSASSRSASLAPPRGHRAPGRCLHVVDDAPHEIGASTGHLTIVPRKLPGAQSIPPIHSAGRTRVATRTGRVVRSAGWRRAGMRSAHDSEHGIGVGYPFVLSQWCLLVDRKVRTRPRSYPQVARSMGARSGGGTSSSRTCWMPRRRRTARPLTARTLRTQLAFSPNIETRYRSPP